MQMQMKVFQIRVKIYLLKDIEVSQIQKKVTAFVDSGFSKTDALAEMHEENKFKWYCFDLLYPAEKDKIYKQGKVYTLTIRTVDDTLARHFSEVCVNTHTCEMKGLTAEIRILPQKIIDTLYTLTPAVLKDDRGYWRYFMTVAEFEERLKVNLVKKWNRFTGEKLSEDFQLCTSLEFLNKVPVSMAYKNIKILGDKFRLHIADNETAQKLAYFALGTGLLEMNARGAGFVNYRWL